MSQSRVKQGGSLAPVLVEAGLLALAAVYFIGTCTFFTPCAVHGETVMACHWAGEALKLISGALAVIAALAVAVRDGRIKAGLELALAPLAVAVMALPGRAIDLCLMNSMRCRSVTRPAALAFGLLIAILAAVAALMRLKQGAAESARKGALK